MSNTDNELFYYNELTNRMGVNVGRNPEHAFHVADDADNIAKFERRTSTANQPASVLIENSDGNIAKITLTGAEVVEIENPNGNKITLSNAGVVAFPGAIGIGVSGTPLSFSQGSPLISLYSTCSSTNGSNSVESFYVETTMTGAGGVGGRGRFYMTTNVALGGWSNALKGEVVYGASGSTAGLGSSICAELTLSAGTTSGTYAPIEGELVLGSGASTGTATSFMYFNATGAGVATFDTNGFLFEIGTGITPAAGKFVSADSQTIKCKVEANTRYVVLSQTENGLGVGASGSAITFAQGSPLVSLYSTCADTSGSSVESMYVETTMTGAGGTGGRARFYMTTNVVLGAWSNALKAEVVYGASGATTGMGSALCAELTLSAGTTSGTYAPIEGEINAGAGCSTGTATSFMYFNGTDGSGLLNDNGFLFELGAALTAGAGHLLDSTVNTSTPQIDHTIKIKTSAGTGYIPVMDNADGS